MKVAPRANWNFLVSNDRRLRNECVKWKNSSAILYRKIDIHTVCKNYISVRLLIDNNKW